MPEERILKFRLKKSEHPKLYDYFSSLKSGQVSAYIRRLLEAGLEVDALNTLVRRVGQLEETVKQLCKAIEGQNGEQHVPSSKQLSQIEGLLAVLADGQSRLEQQLENMQTDQKKMKQELANLASAVNRLEHGGQLVNGLEREQETKHQDESEGVDDDTVERREMYKRGLESLINGLMGGKEGEE